MICITISGYFIKHSRVGGAEYYLYALVEGLIENKVTVNLLVANTNDLCKEFVLRNKSKYLNIIEKKWFGFSSRFINESFAGLFFDKKSEIILYPNYFSSIFHRKKHGKKVTVIYDMQYLVFPENFKKVKRVWLKLQHIKSILFSNKVVFISEAVRDHAEKCYGFMVHKYNTIHVPVSWARFRESDKNNENLDNYILSVGAFYPHKNLEALVKGFLLVSHLYPGLRLKLIGQTPDKIDGRQNLYGQELIDIISLHSDKVILTGHVADHQLGEEIRGCALFCFPSLFEGFGIPVVEALGFKKKVVCSDIPVLKEVTLNSATSYIANPASPKSWGDAIINALLDGFDVEDKVSRGVQEEYSPKRIARAYLELVS